MWARRVSELVLVVALASAGAGRAPCQGPLAPPAAEEDGEAPADQAPVPAGAAARVDLDPAGRPVPAARGRVDDRTGLFDEEEIDGMEDRLEQLAAESGFEVRLVAREMRGFEAFAEHSDRLFQEAVGRLGHYRLALVLIAVDRGAGRGMVGTNLGAGLGSAITREEAADLFLSEGEPFSPARIRGGVELLAKRLTEYATMARAAQKRATPEPVDPGYSWNVARLYPVLGFLGALVAGAWWLWRARFCPECGTRLKSRIRLGGPGGMAVRTAKCFDCGYVVKSRYEPAVPWSRGRTPGARGEGGP